MKVRDKVKRFFKIFIDKIKTAQLADTGAILAYNMLFSLFPLIIVILNIISFAFKGRETFVLEILNLFPEGVAQVIRPVVLELIESSSGGLVSISILVSLWSASKIMDKLMKEISEAFDYQRQKSFIFYKLLSILPALALTIAFLALLVSGPLSNTIINFIESILGDNLVIDFIFELFLYVLPYVFIILILTIIYKLSVLKAPLGLKDLLPASIFTTLAFFILTMAFTFYIDNFASYTSTYGSLGGIIVLLLWLYLAGIVIVLGGYFAASLIEYRKTKIV